MTKKKDPKDKKKAVKKKPEVNPVGRPPMFKTPEEIQNMITDYFISGVRKRKILVGKGDNARVEEIEVPTITGLCYYLGFESRQSFYEYELKDEFTYTIKRARLFIEVHYEEMLQTGNTTGAIFALKNFDWKDTQHNINENKEPLKVIVSNESDKKAIDEL